MSLTLTNTNYNGEVVADLYSVFGIGNEIMQKGAATLITNISTKGALPKFSQTENPIGDYAAGVPSADTVTTTYAERELVMEKMTLYEEFIPTTFHDIWDEFKSQGDFTNLELNNRLLMAILDLYKNTVGRQMSKLFWQGDKTLGAGNAMNKFNGIVTRAIADANVIKPTPQGNITTSNFVDILADVWSSIPDHHLDNPDFKLHVNTTDWKTMMNGNTQLKGSFEGVFGMDLNTMFQTKKIVHFQGMPRHYIVGAETRNLNMGVWIDPESEDPLVDRVANNSREWFIRIDYKADANYISPTELLLYEPA